MAATSPVPERLLRAPFTVAQARAVGVAEGVLRRGRFRQVHRGVYVSAALPDSVGLRADAARLAMPPSAVLSFETAVELFELPGPAAAVSVHVTVEPGVGRRAVEGIVCHVAPVGDDVLVRRGRRLTTTPRTFLDVATRWGLLDLVVLGDAAVRRNLTTPNALVARSATYGGRGCRLARQAASLVVPKVDSPMETYARLLLVLAGLPAPEVGLDLYDEHGGWLSRPDLCYLCERIAIEYQGDQHRTDKQQWRDDVAARRLLRRRGWEVVELTAPDLVQRPQLTLNYIHGLLVERGHPAVPPMPSDGWRAHWPSIG